jgi:hypothetical protein
MPDKDISEALVLRSNPLLLLLLHASAARTLLVVLTMHLREVLPGAECESTVPA